MKKLIKTLMVITVIIGTITGCSNNTMSKEEMVKNAEEVTTANIQNDFVKNRLNAEDKYCDKILKMTLPVSSIDENYISHLEGNTEMHVYLSNEDMKKIESNQYITIVGKSSKSFNKEESDYQEINSLDIKNAYIVQDRFEVTFYFRNENYSYAPAWDAYKKSKEYAYKEYAYLVYFRDNSEVKKITDLGASLYYKAKINAKLMDVVRSNGKVQYEDAVIIGTPKKVSIRDE